MMLGSSGGLVADGGSSAGCGGGGGGEAVVVAGSSSSIMSSGGGIGEDENKSGGCGGGGGEFYEGDRSTGGNRWPRQETLALLKIRSDMDGVFRDSSLKTPLWDEVSRKMAELGYHRSSKKCKEKFENVYKYHKRTKDGRVGKSDGKTYRFFDQLEALEQHHASSSSQLPPLPPPTPRAHQAQMPPAHAAVPVTMVFPAGVTPASTTVVTVTSTPPPVHQSQMNVTAHQSVQQQQQHLQQHSRQQQNHQQVNVNVNANVQETGLYPSDTPSSSSTSSDEELLGRRKRKRKWKDFFERLMREVTDKQEQLQMRFLEAVEKREHDRLAREEAWKAQEMGRLNREHEILVRERSMAAAKDAALIDLLKKLSDHHQIPMPFPVEPHPQSQPQPQPQPQPSLALTPVPAPAPVTPASTPASQQVLQPRPIPQPQQVVTQIIAQEFPVSLAMTVSSVSSPPQIRPQALMVSSNRSNPNNVEVHEQSKNGKENQHLQQQASSSRWPKAEVQALINLRTKLDEKYQENGPKGPLWEEISSLMKEVGYNRNAKRCKEKWENINKYFKKVKESNKKRPEDSKTCPYFHQLDALYRRKATYSSNPSPDPIVPSTTTTTTTTYANKPENLNTMGPIMAQPDPHWHTGSGDDTEDDEDDDDDDDDDLGGGYEIVANNNNNSNNNNGGHGGVHSMTTATTTTSAATATATAQ